MQEDDPGLGSYFDNFFGSGDGSTPPRPPRFSSGPVASAPGPTTNIAGPAASTGWKPRPWADLWAQSNQNPQQFAQSFIGTNNLVGKQTDPTALKQILDAMNGVQPGWKLADPHYSTPGGPGEYKGLTDPNGQFIKMLSGTDQWEWLPGGDQPGGAAGTAGTYGDPAFQKFLDMLTAHESATQGRAQTFADQLGDRVKQLQAPLMNDQQVQGQRTQVMNRVEAARDAALKNARERTYARGFEPTSGILEGTNRSINESYGQQESAIDASLANSMIQTDEARRNEATQLQGLATQALEGGDISALQSQAQAVNLSNMGLDNGLRALGSGGSPGSALASILSLLGPAAGQQQVGLGINSSNMSGLAAIIQMLLG